MVYAKVALWIRLYLNDQNVLDRYGNQWSLVLSVMCEAYDKKYHIFKNNKNDSSELTISKNRFETI